MKNEIDFRYYKILQFPHMPDMVFPDNILSLEYSKGGRIQFTALDAMKCIDITRLPIQVACAEEWQESRLTNTNIHYDVSSYGFRV